MQTKSLPKAMLFDFDGVLVESKLTHHTAWKDAFLNLFGTEICPYPEHLNGSAPACVSEFFCNYGGDPSRCAELAQAKLNHLLCTNHPPKLLPGVREMFGFLSKNNIPFGVASNAPQRFVVNTLALYNLNVSHVLGVEQYSKPKPDPEPYHMLAKLLNVASSEYERVWVCEDSLTGMRAAVASGMIGVGITTHYSATQLKEIGARDAYQSVGEVLSQLM